MRNFTVKTFIIFSICFVILGIGLSCKLEPGLFRNNPPPPPVAMKSITAFTFNNSGESVIIEENSRVIEVSLPYGSSLNPLTPTISHNGAAINPASGQARDFSAPLIYSVTATDGSTKAYTVNVTVRPLSADKAIIAFSLNTNGESAYIDESTHIITVSVPYGTPTNRTPTLFHNGATVNPASGIQQNFSGAVHYTVTASNNSTQVYSVVMVVRDEVNPGDVTIIPSRTSGVGPLMVHFTAEFPAQEDPAVWFHQYEYLWDFGDTGSGNWGTNGLPKNSAKGAVAAHVFETPGQYIINLTVKESGTVIATNSVAVSVLDPEVFYAGTKTTCVNPGGDDDFSEAPAGSRNISTDDISTITRFATAGSRILFKRGGVWNSRYLTRDDWPENAGPVTIGAYGTGTNPDAMGHYANAPVITVIGSDTEIGDIFFPTDCKQDWRLMDLVLRDPVRNVRGATSGGTLMKQQLFLRLKITGFEYAFGWGSYNDPSGPQTDQMAVVSCVVTDASQMVAYVGSERLVLLGNKIENAGDSHVTRVWQAYKSIISNNIMSGSSLDSDTGRHALKLHGPNAGDLASTGWDHLNQQTGYTIVSDNVFGSSGPWPVVIGPTDDWTDCQISNIIFERNRYCGDYGERSVASNPLMISLRLHISRSTIRNNIFDATNFGNEITGIYVLGSGNVTPASRDLWIYNNTVYKPGNPDGVSWTAVEIRPGATNIIAHNNLAAFPYTDSRHNVILDQGDGTSALNNLLNGVSFINPDNSNPLIRSFALTAGSLNAINQGLSVSAAFEDFTGKARPQPVGGAYDIGAYEY